MLCAEGVIRDAETNALSVFNILENIRPAGYPILIQHNDILTILERLPEDADRSEGSMRVTLGDIEIAALPISLDFQGKLILRSIVKLHGLVLPNPGVLTFNLMLADRTLNTYRITIETLPVIAEPH